MSEVLEFKDGVGRFKTNAQDLIEDDYDTSTYLDTSTEQIMKEFKEKGTKADAKRLRDIHEEKHIHHLDWYLAAVNPPKDYVAALQIADKDKSLCVGAEAKGWYGRTCENTGNAIFTPQFTGEKWSPLRYKKNNSQRANRAATKQFNMLKGYDCATVDLTFPKEISEDYGAEKKGMSHEEWEEKAWDTFKTFYYKMRDDKAVEDKHIGCHANLHIWKSQEPMKPHLHFHTIFNRVQAPYVTNKDRKKAIQSRKVQRFLEKYNNEDLSTDERMGYKRKADRQLASELGVETFDKFDHWKGKYFDADKVRELWEEAVKENFPDYAHVYDNKEPSVYLQHYKEGKDTAQIVHKYKYKTRQVPYDLFKYYSDSDVFPEQDTPNHVTHREYENSNFLSHALNYTNKAKNFGVFKWAKSISEIDGIGIGDMCPFCGSTTHATDGSPEDFADMNGSAWILEMKDAFYEFDPPPGHALHGCTAT